MSAETGGCPRNLIAICRERYGIDAVTMSSLPLGIDRHNAIYRVLGDDGSSYFLKLRRGNFRPISVMLQRYLSNQGIVQIIPPLPTRDGNLWTRLKTGSLILYPFIHGHDGYQRDLTAGQWRELGRALSRIHSLKLPTDIRDRLPQETYDPQWRRSLRRSLDGLPDEQPADPIAADLVTLLRAKRDLILDLIGRAERLALQLKSAPLDLVLCHSDLHPGNLLLTPTGRLYIVDWDEPVLAPKERDLTFMGGASEGAVRHPPRPQHLFYKSYGQTRIEPVALAYYHFQRLVEDIAIFSDRIRSGLESDQERGQALRLLRSSFLPGSAVDNAYRAERIARRASPPADE